MAGIDIRQLEYFIAAATSGSFVKAAKLVNVSQPAITKSIQRMEKWLGHLVFERGPELKLTEFGMALIADANRVLGGFDDFLHTANAYGKTLSVKLKIGAGPLVAESMVGEAIGRLLMRFPGLKTTILVENYNTFPAILREGGIDLFVADISELKNTEDLVIRKLKPERFQWFCRKEHPLAGRSEVTMADLKTYPMVLPEMPAWALDWFTEWMPDGMLSSSPQLPYQPTVSCSHYSTLMQIVLASNAVSALTEVMLRRGSYAAQFAIINFKGDRPASKPGIVSLKKRQLSSIAQSLIREIIAVSEQT